MNAEPRSRMHCECLDPFHNGQPCVREAADHGEVVASPALCWPCLFGCEHYIGCEGTPARPPDWY